MVQSLRSCCRPAFWMVGDFGGLCIVCSTPRRHVPRLALWRHILLPSEGHGGDAGRVVEMQLSSIFCIYVGHGGDAVTASTNQSPKKFLLFDLDVCWWRWTWMLTCSWTSVAWTVPGGDVSIADSDFYLVLKSLSWLMISVTKSMVDLRTEDVCGCATTLESQYAPLRNNAMFAWSFLWLISWLMLFCCERKTRCHGW